MYLKIIVIKMYFFFCRTAVLVQNLFIVLLPVIISKVSYRH